MNNMDKLALELHNVEVGNFLEQTEQLEEDLNRMAERKENTVTLNRITVVRFKIREAVKALSTVAEIIDSMTEQKD